MIASFLGLAHFYSLLMLAILYRSSKMVKTGEVLLSLIMRVISGACEVVVGGEEPNHK